jgi:hypothetical protein
VMRSEEEHKQRRKKEKEMATSDKLLVRSH